MKSLNNKTFLAYPISLIAAIVDNACNSKKSNCKMSTLQVANGGNNPEILNIMEICESPYFSLLSQQELDALLSVVYCRFGTIKSFLIRKIYANAVLEKLECVYGFFKMTLIIDSYNKITAIDIVEESVL